MALHRLARITVTTTAAVAAVVAGASAASAAPSGNPEAVRTANPAHSCAAIPGTLAQFGITPEDFSYRDCVRELAGRVPLTAFGGDAYARCAQLEEGAETPIGFFELTYPYTFHAEPGDPFPDLTAANRGQCARALWAYHTIEEHLAAPPEAG